jgi:hypothetical protein
VINAEKKLAQELMRQQAVVVGAINTPYTMGGAGVCLIYEGPTFVVGMEVWTSVAGTTTASGAVDALGKAQSLIFLPDTKVAVFATESGTKMILSWEIEEASNCAVFRLSEVTVTQGDAISNSMHVAIGISGFITIGDARFSKEEQHGAYWYPILKSPSVLGMELAEGYYLQWETMEQLIFGQTLESTITNTIKDGAVGEAKKRITTETQKAVLAATVFMSYFTIMAAAKIPSIMSWSAGVIDNSFAILTNRGEHAGVELANALINAAHGRRPVTLIAVSCGAALVVQCLKTLHSQKAFGIVESVYLLGCTARATKADWRIMREVVAGRIVNVFSRKDWFLAFLFRTNLGSLRPVPGLSRVRGVPGVENVDCSAVIPSHAYYGLRLKEVLALIPPQPTAETLNPEGYSPGIVMPFGPDMKHHLAKFHDTMSGSHKITICVKNKTREPFTFVTSKMECGVWDFAPPDTIQAATAGVMGCVTGMKSSNDGVTGILVYKSTELSVIVSFSYQKGDKSPSHTAMICSPEEGSSLPAYDPTRVKLTASSGNVYLLKERMDDSGIIRVTIHLRDDEFVEQLNALKDIESWVVTPTEGQEEGEEMKSVPSLTSEDGGLSRQGTLVPGLVVPLENVPSSLKELDLRKRRLAIVICNRSSCPLTYRGDVLISGGWKLMPGNEMAPGEALICGTGPRDIHNGACGVLVFDCEGCSILLGFRQNWNSKNEATCCLGSSGAFANVLLEESGSWQASLKSGEQVHTSDNARGFRVKATVQDDNSSITFIVDKDVTP